MWSEKIEDYDKLFGHLITWGPFLLATDASVSLLETQAMLGDACARYKKEHGTRPPISLYVAAWYPWHYDSTPPLREKTYTFERAPGLRLGVDSMAIFYVCDESGSDGRNVDVPLGGADVKLQVDRQFIDTCHMDFHNMRYTGCSSSSREGARIADMLDSYSREDGFPGYHYTRYANPNKGARPTEDAYRLLLESFLKQKHAPTSLECLRPVKELQREMRAKDVSLANRERRDKRLARCEAGGEEPAKVSCPVIAPPYLRIEETRVSLQPGMAHDRFRRGGLRHHPLFITVRGIGRQLSESKEQRRSNPTGYGRHPLAFLGTHQGRSWSHCLWTMPDAGHRGEWWNS